jgi:hypothetical protein
MDAESVHELDGPGLDATPHHPEVSCQLSERVCHYLLINYDLAF